MTRRQDQLANAVFNAVFRQAKNLTLGELMLLRSVYTKDGAYASLTPALKERFLNVGTDIVAAVVAQQQNSEAR